MSKTGLNAGQMDKYIPVLMKADLLEVSFINAHAIYLTTAKGLRFLDVFDMLIELVDSRSGNLLEQTGKRF